MKYYHTSQLTDKIRALSINGIHFDVCEHCNVHILEADTVNVRFYSKYNLVLCDRCVDNFDGITVWSDKFARSRKLPSFPKAKSI